MQMQNTAPLTALTDFKFACPFCDQHLVCDGSQRGTKIQCPSCQNSIAVPTQLHLVVRNRAVWTELAPEAPALVKPAPGHGRRISASKERKL